MAQRLTDPLIKKLAPPKRGYEVTWDSEVRGFGVRITADGVRSFILNYRTRGGTERRLTLGRYDDPWRTEGARQQARDLKAEIRLGRDPLGELEDERAAPTIKAL